MLPAVRDFQVIFSAKSDSYCLADGIVVRPWYVYTFPTKKPVPDMVFIIRRSGHDA
jgi:hypothetical protein